MHVQFWQFQQSYVVKLYADKVREKSAGLEESESKRQKQLGEMQQKLTSKQQAIEDLERVGVYVYIYMHACMQVCESSHAYSTRTRSISACMYMQILRRSAINPLHT